MNDPLRSPRRCDARPLLRGAVAAVALAAMWVAVSAITWKLGDEDGLRQAGLWLLLLSSSPGLVLMSVSRRHGVFWVLGAFLHLFLAWDLQTFGAVGATVAFVILTAKLWPFMDVGNWPTAGRGIGSVWLTIYGALTPWPFHVWPWSTLHADIRSQMAASAYTVPPPGELPYPERPDIRVVRHPLFRFPISVSLHKDGPIGPGAVSATMYYGDGRFAYFSTRDPLCFLHVSD